MGDKARIDRTLIANLRENSRPLRPETLLTPLPGLSPDETEARRLQSTVEDLVVRLERMEARLDRLDYPSSLAKAEAGHTLFVPTATGYTIVERDGPPPRLGDEIAVDGIAYRAERYRRSPFPADSRSCVVVQPAESATSDCRSTAD